MTKEEKLVVIDSLAEQLQAYPHFYIADIESLNRDLAVLAADYPDLKIIGTGGNINKLYRLKGNKNDNRLDVADLKAIYDELKALTVEERISAFRLNPDRADVIIPAAEIFLNIAERIHADSICVPTIGITDGIAHALYIRYLNDRED